MDFRRRSPVTWPSVGAAKGSGGAIRRQSRCEDEAKKTKKNKICSYARKGITADSFLLSSRRAAFEKCSRASGPNDNVAKNRCTLESRNNLKKKKKVPQKTRQVKDEDRWSGIKSIKKMIKTYQVMDQMDDD